MVDRMLPLVLLSVLLLSVLKADQDLLDLLHTSTDWELVENFDEGHELLVKKIDGRNLDAVMVRQEINIDPDIMTEVVLDIPDYPRFLTANPGLQSRLINQMEQWRDGYQYLEVPFVSDRHYFFRMFPVKINSDWETSRVDWLLLPERSGYELPEIPVNNSPVYLNYGAGSWLLKPVGNGQAEVSYRLYLDHGGKIPSFLVDRINAVSIVNLFRDAVSEMQRRQEEI